ncbi:uncharacterized protein LOC127102980 [Lathyrus oleraceus]|uniref:uncharacterized protein LOC127102980 n=1 Tax=Pisum sativum TaxID=3888 RepID=UPI0021D01ACF|nr:uncharacterized protein LOC127102980 [Pisum sativum]
MNWLEFNHVYIKCFAKTVMFPELRGNGELMFVSAKQVEEFVKKEAHVFAMFASLEIDIKVAMGELSVVCDFPELFPDYISDLPPECEVGFAIELVSGNSRVSMTPYKISTSELSELKKQLEDLLEKKFVRSSVSPWERQFCL